MAFVNNQSLQIATTATSTGIGSQSGSFIIMSMTTGSAGQASFQMTAQISGTIGQLKVINSAGTSSIIGESDNILFAKKEGFPNTPATTFRVDATAIQLSGSIQLNKGSDKPCDIVSVLNGQMTISSSLVTSNSVILLTTQELVNGGVYPAIVDSKTNGSFVIKTNQSDTVSVAYLIINPI
jgi:hypothetical protein